MESEWPSKGVRFEYAVFRHYSYLLFSLKTMSNINFDSLTINGKSLDEFSTAELCMANRVLVNYIKGQMKKDRPGYTRNTLVDRKLSVYSKVSFFAKGEMLEGEIVKINKVTANVKVPGYISLWRVALILLTKIEDYSDKNAIQPRNISDDKLTLLEEHDI